MNHVIIETEAQIDIEMAADWYEEQQPGLGMSFVARITEKIEVVRLLPKAHTKVAGSVSVAYELAFSYGIYFQTIDDTIYILAVLHTSKKPREWA